MFRCVQPVDGRLWGAGPGDWYERGSNDRRRPAGLRQRRVAERKTRRGRWLDLFRERITGAGVPCGAKIPIGINQYVVVEGGVDGGRWCRRSELGAVKTCEVTGVPSLTSGDLYDSSDLRFKKGRIWPVVCHYVENLGVLHSGVKLLSLLRFVAGTGEFRVTVVLV